MPAEPSSVPTLTQARARVLRAVSASPDSVTLAELVEQLPAHPSSTRQHLETLTRQGLIIASPVTRHATGRPPLAYRATAAGRRALAAATSNGYRDVVLAVARYHRGRGDAADVAEQVGEAWGAASAQSLAPEADAWAAAVDALDVNGFSPQPHDQGVMLRSCPLIDAAREAPEFVCRVHLGMVRGVLRRAGDERPVELLPFFEPGGCLLRCAS